MAMMEGAQMTDKDRLDVALARIAALEELLAHYRAGTTPPERLHRELARTKSRLAEAMYGFSPSGG